jgi:nucleoside-diphosphate-sugar epimerase
VGRAPIPGATQRRSFIWVGDVIGAMLTLIASKGPERGLNIGHTKEFSIQHPAALVKRMTHSVSEIVRVPYDEAYEPGFEDMPRRAPEHLKNSAADRLSTNARSA